MGKTPLLPAIDKWLNGCSWVAIVALGTLLVAIIALVDFASGKELTLGPVYVLPVGIVVWYAGRDAGIIVALLSATSTFLASNRQAPVGDGDGAIGLINSSLLLGLYLLMIALIGRVRGRLILEAQLARLDSLTGALNRRAFEEELDYHLALAQREGLPLTLAYIDVDDFKQINDSFGHDGGDRVLQAIASTLVTFCRRTDRVTRLGGDEFAVLMPDTHSHGAKRTIGEARRRFASAFEPNSAHVTCSIGVVTFENQHPHAKTVISMADALMYEVKMRGKGAILFRTVSGGDLEGR